MINSYKVLVGTLKRREYLDDLGVDGRVIFEWVFENEGWERVHWIHLAQDRDQWWAVVTAGTRTPDHAARSPTLYR
jgi:predicted P-loop ATPase